MRKSIAEWLRRLANCVEGAGRLDRQWQAIANTGDKIQAIRAHSEAHGSSLLQAKNAVEAWIGRAIK